MLNFGILGMNARNLSYIKKFNPAKAIHLADDKLETRRFLGERGIPVPQTYDVIKSRKQLYEYDFSELPANEFIVKPNQGSRGRGIYRVRILDEELEWPHVLNRRERNFTLRSPYRYMQYKVNSKTMDDTAFRRYLVDILDGKSSLLSHPDKILVEELLMPWSGFEPYCERGLADIRIITFNLIPVAAMLRVPTKRSEGKANLDRGALGFGLEIGSGKIFSMMYHGRVFRHDFPKPYTSFFHRVLPYRDDLLLYSSKIQYFVNLGFLALDRVITDEGPKLLEINARSWLKFQVASLLPLRSRLEKIKDIKVATPEKGVEIAQSLFDKQQLQVVTPSKVVYLSQHGKITFGEGEKKAVVDVIVEVDLQKRKSYLSQPLFKRRQESTKKTALRLSHHNVVFSDIQRKAFKEGTKEKIILWREVIEWYYIKPIRKVYTNMDFIAPKNIITGELDQMHILDQKINEISLKVNISKVLNPINFLDEMNTFILKQGNYNPTFVYKRPTEQQLQRLRKSLNRLQETYFGHNPLKSKFAQLFNEKIAYLLKKIDFIDAYRTQDQERMKSENERLYGAIDDNLLALAQEKIEHADMQDEKQLGRVLMWREVKKVIERYVAEREMEHVHVVFTPSTAGRITVVRGKKVTVKVNNEAVFREHDLMATLAHEIDVHVLRYQNGLKTWRRILQSGTADYMTDEEWLAIAESMKHLPESYEKQGMYEKYWLIWSAHQYDFAWIAAVVKQKREKSLAQSFKTALRLKKGLEKTFLIGEGSVYYKDKIYLDGYEKIRTRLEEGGDVEQLKVGKVKVEDIRIIF